MSCNWFDFDDDLADELFRRPSKIETLRKNFNLSKIESNKLKSWGSVNEVDNLLDFASSKTGRIWDSVMKDRFLLRSPFGGRSRFSEERSGVGVGRIDSDDFFSDINEKVRRLRNRFARGRIDSESEAEERKRGKEPEKSSSCSSANSSYHFVDVTGDSVKNRKDSIDRSSLSRKSSIQGNVTFPTSSGSNISEASFSEKSMDRSISRNSDDSVCTEKSANCSSVSEKLPDGTSKTQTENNESWISKSSSGSRISEKKVNDSTVTEQNGNKICEKSTKRMSYVEKSNSGSSVQESTSEKVVSCDSKGGTKITEQKNSTESCGKKSFRCPPNKSVFYDELDSYSFRHYVPSSLIGKGSSDYGDDSDKTPVLRRKESFRANRGRSVTEKISKLIDEAVEQDDFFRIPSSLQTDIEDLWEFDRDRRKDGRRKFGSLINTGKTDQEPTWSKFNELKAENEVLQQENSKLQSIIQDVTAVNKRWQKYNNERRLYVQKLLSTIQDLQEQINLISEKSAFQSSGQEDTTSRCEEIEKLRKEHAEHITVLELQIKSHKDDWDAERKEKRKAVQENEELQEKVKELTRDVKFLKNVLQEERNRKMNVCCNCPSQISSENSFSRSEFLPGAASSSPLRVSKTILPKTFRTSVHVPYNTTEISSDSRFFAADDDTSKEGGASSQGTSSYYSAEFSHRDETYTNERYSCNTKYSQGKSGDTIVVQDESGIRLSITEQYPNKDNLQLKSILKKKDKKLKLSSKSFSGQSDLKTDKCTKLTSRRMSSMDEPNILCDEFEARDCGLSIGFRDDGLARITSFSPDSMPASDESFRYLSPRVIKKDSRSKSEPNTRSNSSENLKPLRESSSWNNDASGVDTNTVENVVCPNCDKVFPPPMHLQFLDHFEICPTDDPFK